MQIHNLVCRTQKANPWAQSVVWFCTYNMYILYMHMPVPTLCIGMFAYVASQMSLNSQHVLPSVIQFARSIMVWAAILWRDSWLCNTQWIYFIGAVAPCTANCDGPIYQDDNDSDKQIQEVVQHPTSQSRTCMTALKEALMNVWDYTSPSVLIHFYFYFVYRLHVFGH